MDNTLPDKRASIGDETLRQNPSLGADQFAEQGLMKQISLAEGLQKQQEAYRTTKGKQITETLLNPENRAYGQSPTEGLEAGIGLSNKLMTDKAQNVNSVAALYRTLADIAQTKEEFNLKKQQFEVENGIKIDENGNIVDTSKIPKGAEAVSEVIKQGGSDLIAMGKDLSARSAIAEEILRSGGVKEYRKVLPLTSLVNSTEATALKEFTDLMTKLDYGMSLMTKDEIGGTGPLAQFVPGFISPETTREMRRSVEDIKATYARMLSGKVISDKEIKRLERFLPSSNKTESENYGDMIKLKRDIELNLKLFELSKKEGLTPNQAYEKYGAEIGLPVDEKQSKQTKTLMVDPNGKKYYVDPSEIDEAVKNGWKRS